MQHEWISLPFTHHQNECLITISQSCCASISQDYPSASFCRLLNDFYILYFFFFWAYTFYMFPLHPLSADRWTAFTLNTYASYFIGPVTLPQPTWLSSSASHLHVCLQEKTNHSRQKESHHLLFSAHTHSHSSLFPLHHLPDCLSPNCFCLHGWNVCVRTFVCAGLFLSLHENVRSVSKVFDGNVLKTLNILGWLQGDHQGGCYYTGEGGRKAELSQMISGLLTKCARFSPYWY